MTETTSEQHEPAAESARPAGAASDGGPVEPHERREGAGQRQPAEPDATGTADVPEPEAGPEHDAEAAPDTETEPDAEAGDQTEAAPATPPEEPDPDPDSEGGRLGTRVRGQLRTFALAAAGVALSAVVAAVVSAYLDIWSASEPPPGAPRITAASEVWWDLLNDHHLVRAAPGATYEKKPLLMGDAQDTLAQIVTEGGVDAGMMRIRLILTNLTRTPATITSVRARIERTHPVPAGPLYYCGGPQGTADVSRVTLDLTLPERPAMEQDGHEQPQAQYPSTKVQVAAQGDPAYFDVAVQAGTAAGPTALAYEFVLDIGYTQGSRQQHLIVDASGRPFVLAQGIETWTEAFRCNDTGWSTPGGAG
ncbi:hypothetical protein ACFCXT_09190 [Streptomyces vinaceus]|uniref:hypothetical protein n=1 Tax=Streptomyces vinaceus TaxID=1960 RepID=UPI0035E25A6D